MDVLANYLRGTLKASTQEITYWEAQTLYNPVHARLLRLLLNGPAPRQRRRQQQQQQP